jgi:putative lipoprotein
MHKVLTLILCLAALSQSLLVRADAVSTVYLCIGTEPDWRFDFGPTAGQYKYANQAEQRLSGRLAENEPSKAWTWRGKSLRQRRDLVAELRSGTCDGGGGRQYPFSIAISAADGKRLSGCCRQPETTAQPAKNKVAMLSGVWLRLNPSGGKNARDGFNLNSTGRASLIGMRHMKAAEWRLEGDQLMISTYLDRNLEPVVNRLHIDELSDSTLRLSGAISELAGSYEREATGKVSGTVSYRQRIALPPEALVEVRLLDVTVSDGAAKAIGEQTIRNGGQVPIPFEIGYAAVLIQPAHRYALQVRIVDQGKLLFANVQAYPVITMGSPNRLDVVVQPLGR